MLLPLPQGRRRNMKPRKPQATPRPKRPTARKGPASAASNANAKELALFERIAQRAYELYEQRGGQAGSELEEDRKSTRLNSSHGSISYAVFCLKKKTKTPIAQ